MGRQDMIDYIKENIAGAADYTIEEIYWALQEHMGERRYGQRFFD